ncbi:MAG: dihydrolipoamide acetyltransferase family protein [Planctomycetota bacterium]
MAHAKSTDPNVFILPDLGEGVHEAEMISWKVKVGDTVKEHDILAEMETDKALVEVPSPRAGTIKQLHGNEGEILNVGNPLVTYEGRSGGGEVPVAETKPAADASSNGAAEREDAGTVVGAMTGEIARGEKGKALAAPAVRRMARDLGVDINQVPGTGIAGRVTKKDVEAFAKDGPKAASGGSGGQSDASRGSASASGKTDGGLGGESRRPLPRPAAAPQPQYQQPPMPQPGYGMPAAQAMPQAMPHPAPGYGMPMQPMPMYIPIPVPMPMPGYGMPGYGAPQPPAGVPFAPGYTPASGARPIPDPAQQSAGDGRVAFRGVRRTIANRLRESVNTAVHFTVMDEADVTTLDAVRRQLAEAAGQKISFLPFVAAAVCRAIGPAAGGRFGALNATVDEANEEIVNHSAVHLGIATDTDSGLMVPVIPGAHGMDVVTLSNEIAATAKSARDRSISRDRLMGSTFTISNVGSHAGKFATPVINVPEVAILAVGKVYDGVVVRDGQAVVGKLMPLSLACDHRVVDGATAALCLAEIVRLLRDEAERLV